MIRMKRILLTLFLGIFLVSSVSALDDTQLPQACGGDNQLIIGCLGDEELVFLAGLPPSESRGGPGVPVGAEQTTTDKEKVLIEEIEKPSILSRITSFFKIKGKEIGNKIWEGNPIGGVLVLFLVIMVVGFFGWRYKGVEKLKRWRKMVKRKRVERRRSEEGW